MAAPLTTLHLLAAAARTLAVSSDTPELDAQLLLAHALATSRSRLQSHPEEERSDSERAAYESLIERRARGEPVAYITGYKEFWSLRFAVNQAVLVPRPETELVVERALALIGARAVRVLDLGTGAGAIALALAHERPNWRITATDASEAALEVARSNAVALGFSAVKFASGSWFEPLAEQRFDLIVSNPPYIGEDDPALLQAALRYEPKSALTPGGDALADLRRIIRAAPAHLERGGWLLLEHGAAQAAEVARELVVRGFRHVRSQRDLAGHERMTEAQWGIRIPHEK
jgi:release factor glutamine methyltransferase